MEKKQKRIVVDQGLITRLAFDLNTSRPTVSRALRGPISTALHVRIRRRAIELGGIEISDTERIQI